MNLLALGLDKDNVGGNMEDGSIISGEGVFA